MRRRSLVALLLGFASASACLVPTFDVGPIPGASGGSSLGGGASAGKAAAEAGRAAAGATASAGKAGGGTASGGTASGGTTQTMMGSAGAAGEDGASGAAGAGNGALGPFRVGFSEFHDSASGNDNASSSLPDATFAKPSGTVPGDFMLVFFGADHSLQNLSASHLALTGWTLHEQHSAYGMDGQATYLAYKFAGAAEPDPIVFAHINDAGSGDGVQGLLSVYRGLSSTAPINAYQIVLENSGATTSAHVETPTPAITTTVDNCLLIAGFSPDTAIDAPSISDWPVGFNQNRVSVTNPPNPSPYGWANIYSAERHQPSAGTLPASFFGWDMTYGGTTYDGALTFVLALAPAP